MKRYDEMTSTPEAVWFSSIPSTWRTTKIRELFSERNTKVSDKDYPALSVGKMGIVPQLDTAVKTDNGDNRKLICKGDFAINSRSDRKGAGGISDFDGSCSLIITVLKPHKELNSRFYHYLLRSHYFSEEYYRNGKGLVSDLWTTKWDTMQNIYIPVPPSSEQDQIVRYLDWQTLRINKLIKGYKRQIELLEERKKAVVSNAIIHGLKKDIPLKDSGVYWIGDIPKHWSTIKLRRILSPVSIKNCPDMQLLSVVREQGVIIRDTENKESNHNYIPDDLSNYKVVRKNQFVINKMKAWQGSYGVSGYDGLVSPAYFVFNVNFNNLEYFHYAIRSKVYVNFFAQASDGIRVGQWDLDMQKMKEIPFIVPSEEEQVEIVRYIKKEHKKLDVSIEKWKSKIELLKEYRTRLISDVVTGQVDVRDIQIPEYIPEEETEMTDMEVEKDAD